MCVSMSASTSSSGPSLGRAKTAYPKDRIASTQPRMDTAPPGGTLANTQPSTSREPASVTSHRATASKRGRDAGVGRPPITLASVMSMFGASQTSRSSSVRPSPAPSSAVPGGAGTGSAITGSSTTRPG